MGLARGPTCIVIEPAYGRYVYTANNLDNSVTGFKLSPNPGVLTTVLNSPFPAGGLPDCIATSANGTHPVQEHYSITSNELFSNELLKEKVRNMRTFSFCAG